MVPDTKPLVTAVVPVYDHEQYVVESICSIIAQDYPNVELLIIDDGSRDHSHEMVLTMLDACRARFVRFEYIKRENRGLSATLNQALDWAQGKYFSPLASDDRILPDKFSSLVEAFETAAPNCAAVVGDASFIDENGRDVFLDGEYKPRAVKSEGTYSTWLEMFTRSVNFDYRREFGTFRTLLTGCYIPPMAGLLSTACLRKAGGWTMDNAAEDWEMWLKLSKHHSILFADQITALYRVHGANSVITMKPQLLRDSIMLMAREKEYCIRRKELKRAWEDCYYNLVYRMLRFDHFPVSERLRRFKFRDTLPLLALLFRGLRERMQFFRR
jgi:alpha-1,3-rhamnosyltransferase